MINILASLILILALKWAFLFLFEPKREQRRSLISFVSNRAVAGRKISCRKSTLAAASDVCSSS
jgi:hypothetical protein